MRHYPHMPRIKRITDQIYDMKPGLKPLVINTTRHKSIRNMASRIGKECSRVYTCRARPDGRIEVWRTE